MYFFIYRTTLQVFVTYLIGALYFVLLNKITGIFEIIVAVLTTCHTQYT